MLNDSMEEVIKLANRVRYKYDIKENTQNIIDELEDSWIELKNHLYANELLISKNITPELYDAIQRVSERLNFSSSSISSFVYASPEINASCMQESDNNCVLRFSSGLIDILNPEEFEFVVGHELGHYLLKHLSTSDSNNQAGLEHLIKLRSQEISADRIGLLGCKSLAVSIRAIFKTVSGLNDKHLRFDVSKYISQLSEVSHDSISNIEMTHPSMPVRCRALLWFSISHAYLNINDYNKNDLRTLDDRVKKDMDRYVDSSSLSLIEYTKYKLALWQAAYSIIQKEKFSKEEQIKFEEKFGKSSLEEIIAIFSQFKKSDADKLIYRKFKKYRDSLEDLIPISFEDELLKLNWDDM